VPFVSEKKKHIVEEQEWSCVAVAFCVLFNSILNWSIWFSCSAVRYYWIKWRLHLPFPLPALPGTVCQDSRSISFTFSKNCCILRTSLHVNQKWHEFFTMLKCTIICTWMQGTSFLITSKVRSCFFVFIVTIGQDSGSVDCSC
jgi:hypothetical protein